MPVETMNKGPLDIFDYLPDLHAFRGTRVLIKYGGNAMFDSGLKKSVIRDIAFLKMVGLDLTIVHGGGPAISEHMDRVGLEPEFLEGQRKTDKATMEIVEMVLCGKVNNDLVKMLNSEGVAAVGLSGKDGGLVVARKHTRTVEHDGVVDVVDLGHVGEIAHIRPDIVNLLIRNHYIPVIAPIGVGTDDQDYNINADLFAGEMAGSIHADRVVFLTDINGIFRDRKNQGSRIPGMTVEIARDLMRSVIQGGMIPKVEASLKALEHGVEKVHIINGMEPHSLLKALLTHEEAGTTIYR